ncbi:MAG: hypothetical protein J5746_05660 [Victivallales bacterium]|nr:hypothetical protein [Victivallales bacterium]
MFRQEDERHFGVYPCDEAQVPKYELPNPLLKPDGGRVTTAQEWMNSQRMRILDIFKEYEYGEVLPFPQKIWFEELSRKDDALDGIAIRKEIRIHAASANGRTKEFDMLLYMPRDAEQHPVPAFLGLNFKGNHATTFEADVHPTGLDILNGLPQDEVESHRGCQERRWCFKETVSRGYASATICYHDIFRDKTGYGQESVFRLFYDVVDMEAVGEKYTPIGAWAWGLSRGLDCLSSQAGIQPDRVAVHGHSRLGKTSLWAGAIDTRFAMVISNCSGCCGGALHRRKYGENLSQHFQSHLNWGVPCWFVNKLDNFIWREEELPFDQHELMALAAPRPLAIATATEDQHADPKGEFLAAVAASEVYGLFGSRGLPADEMPDPDVNITGDISYHCRTGIHDQTWQDWEHYLHLADIYLAGRKS